MKFVRLLVTSVFVSGLAACAASAPTQTLQASATNAPAATQEVSDNTATDEDYRIGSGDTLAINVWRNEDLSVSVPVRPDGKISVPLAGDVAVGNRTPEEVSAAITQKLAKYIRDPFVTVIVTGLQSGEFRNRVRVTGAVQRPVSLPYRPGMTVLDLVLEAGGVNEFANPGRASLYRKDGSSHTIRLDRILKRGELKTNYDLRPGDIVTVPQSAF